MADTTDVEVSTRSLKNMEAPEIQILVGKGQVEG